MLSNVKTTCSLLLLSSIVAVSSAAAVLNNPATSYQVQEDAIFDANRNPSRDTRNNGIGPVYFLEDPARFIAHKPTLFSKINRNEEVTRLVENFSQDNFQHVVAYAAHITKEDARAISSKHNSFQTCTHLRFLLMASPLKALRALSSECIGAVAAAARKRHGLGVVGPVTQRKNDFVQAFVANSYELDKNIWSRHFDDLSYLAARYPLGATPAAVQAREDYSKYGDRFELFIKDDERCGARDANHVLASISTAQAAKLTRSSCFTSMQNYDTYVPANAKRITHLPKTIFSEVDKELHADVYKYMTGEQVANFGSKSKDTHCSALRIQDLSKGRLVHIDASCWSSYLTGFSTAATTTPSLGNKIKSIKADAWDNLTTDAFLRIHQDDLQYIPGPTMTKFLTAHPDICENLETVDTQKVSIVVPDCFIRLTSDQQMRVMEKRGSAFPVAILAKFTRESVEKMDGNLSAMLRDVKFTSDQIKVIGRDSQKPEEHPCSALSKDELIGAEPLMNNMSEHCFAALTCLGDLESGDISRLPKSLLAMLPYDKLMLMVADDDKDYFANLDAAAVKHLMGKDFCAKVTEPVFKQIKTSALISVNEHCAAALTFKKSLTETQIRAFSPRAFRRFTNAMTAELPAITAMTPEQFHELSADVTEVSQSAGQLLTKEVLASLPSEYIAKLSEGLLGATPVASFAAFSTKDVVVALPPASLRRVSAEQIKAVPVVAVSALTVAQVQELGVALTDASTSPITHLLADKHVKLSIEAHAAAVKRAEQDVERFAKAVAKTSKSSASTVSVSLFGLLLAAVALAF